MIFCNFMQESTSSGQARVKNPEGIQLKTLIITGCAELEHIIVKDDDERDKVSLQNHIQSMCFTNLLHIEVYRCNKLKRLFPIAIAQGLPHVKYLEIIETYQLVEVFDCDGEAETNDKKEIVMPKLVRLTLKELTSLIHFCPGRYHFVFPCLETLTVQGCPLITTRFTIAPNGSVHAKAKVLEFIIFLHFPLFFF